MDKGKGKEKVKAIIDMINDRYDPFMDDMMVPPNSLFPHNPCFEEDGWVSDEEGHPELSRISPCTFARWSTGCAAAALIKLQKPVIPCRTSSLGRNLPKQQQHAKVSRHSHIPSTSTLPDTHK
jgi:hypothetical protein